MDEAWKQHRRAYYGVIWFAAAWACISNSTLRIYTSWCMRYHDIHVQTSDMHDTAESRSSELPHSIISAKDLLFRVGDGNEWFCPCVRLRDDILGRSVAQWPILSIVSVTIDDHFSGRRQQHCCMAMAAITYSTWEHLQRLNWFASYQGISIYLLLVTKPSTPSIYYLNVSLS